MENEVSKGVWIGVALLGITVVLAIILWIFTSSKDTANSGSVDANEKLKVLSNQAFTDFDQKIVSGQQVLGALKTFEDKPYAVIISTKKVADVTKPPTDIHTGAKKFKVKPFKGGSVPVDALNYNAILADIGTSPENGYYITDKGVTVDSDNDIKYDNLTENISKNGFAEYVSPTTKFRAHIIKTTEGDNAGVVFVQK